MLEKATEKNTFKNRDNNNFRSRYHIIITLSPIGKNILYYSLSNNMGTSQSIKISGYGRRVAVAAVLEILV